MHIIALIVPGVDLRGVGIKSTTQYAKHMQFMRYLGGLVQHYVANAAK